MKMEQPTNYKLLMTEWSENTFLNTPIRFIIFIMLMKSFPASLPVHLTSPTRMSISRIRIKLRLA